MCGIHASISRRDFEVAGDGLKNLLSRRGPDHTGEEQVRIETDEGLPYYVSFTSTVLALRGGQVTSQPFRSTNSILCWNGEAWKVGIKPVVDNDGQFLFDLLSEASSPHKSSVESATATVQVLRSISGPFSFVYMDKAHKTLYFGRDRLGRRSLLYSVDKASGSMEFSSSGDPTNSIWKEVEADGFYQLSFTNQQDSFTSQDLYCVILSDALLPMCRHVWEISDAESPVRLHL